MSQLSGTLPRPTSLVPAAVAGLVLAAAIAIGMVASGSLDPVTGDGRAPAAPVAPVARTDRAAILARIQSEYLLGVADGWYRDGSGVDENLFYSEYLRELARDW